MPRLRLLHCRCPGYRLVTYIKRYVTAIAVTTHDVVIQRQQTADQLRCRVPLPLANRLLAGEDLTSDYFASATVLVCQLAKAHSLPTRHPAEVIGQVARELHQTVQQMARSHDAYVLFYGSTKFVVVSGESNETCLSLVSLNRLSVGCGTTPAFVWYPYDLSNAATSRTLP